MSKETEKIRLQYKKKFEDEIKSLSDENKRLADENASLKSELERYKDLDVQYAKLYFFSKLSDEQIGALKAKVDFNYILDELPISARNVLYKGMSDLNIEEAYTSVMNAMSKIVQG